MPEVCCYGTYSVDLITIFVSLRVPLILSVFFDQLQFKRLMS